MNMQEVIELGKSWAFAPEITIKGDNFISRGFDRSERCYQLENNNTITKKLEFEIAGSKENPICNPSFFIKNWTSEKASVLVNGKPIKDVRIGLNHELEGDNLVIFLFLEKNEPVSITILP
jgi:hypothetical protein